MAGITAAGNRKATRVLVGVTLALGVASYVTLYAALRGGPGDDLHQYLYVGEEQNLPTWWNTGLLAGASATAWLALAARPRGRERWAWAAIGAVTAGLSLDEATRLHERTGALTAHIDIPTFRWVIVGGIASVVGAVVLGFLVRRLPRRVALGLAAAFAIYVGAAVGLEAVSGWFYYQGRPYRAASFTHAEEALEMLACVLLIRVILDELAPLQLVRPAASQATEPPPDHEPEVETAAVGVGFGAYVAPERVLARDAVGARSAASAAGNPERHGPRRRREHEAGTRR